MHNDNVDDMRNSVRQKVDSKVDVNEGAPNRGGLLKDISTRGAAVEYVPGLTPIDGPLTIGEVVHLDIGATAFPSRIVRTFNNGFAVQFDWSLHVANER